MKKQYEISVNLKILFFVSITQQANRWSEDLFSPLEILDQVTDSWEFIRRENFTSSSSLIFLCKKRTSQTFQIELDEEEFLEAEKVKSKALQEEKEKLQKALGENSKITIVEMESSITSLTPISPPKVTTYYFTLSFTNWTQLKELSQQTIDKVFDKQLRVVDSKVKVLKERKSFFITSANGESHYSAKTISTFECVTKSSKEPQTLIEELKKTFGSEALQKVEVPS